MPCRQRFWKTRSPKTTGALILDFAQVQFIGGAALWVLFSSAGYPEERNAKLIVCGLSESVRRVPRVTCIARFLTIHGTRAGARASADGCREGTLPGQGMGGLLEFW